MKHRIIPAIMSGGAGARLWPLSTSARPKQFHVVRGERTLIQDTAARVSVNTDEIDFLAPLILCNAVHADLVTEQLEDIGVTPSAIVMEPEGRNTAIVAAVAGALASEIDPDALVLLLPADHVIENRFAFTAAIALAAPYAHERLCAFGVAPNRPETGYGYIKQGQALGEGVFEVSAFREKPGPDLAESYLSEGGYLWNAGIFLFHPSVLAREFAAAPRVRQAALESLERSTRVGARIALDAEAFAAAPAMAFDIAVMERTERAAVTPCDMGWTDVGAWDEIWRLALHDEAGNAVSGAADFLDARDNLVHSAGPHVYVAGLSDLIVVATGDTVLILPRDRAQDVRRLKELSAQSGD